MPSLSVKDRAKMFGALASPDNAEKDRSYRRMGNKVTSSPFKSPVASNTTPTAAKFPASPFASNSPAARGTPNFPASPFSSSSPKTSVPVTATSSSSTYPKPFSVPKEKNTTPLPSQAESPLKRNAMSWPDEDGIPAPDANINSVADSAEHHDIPVEKVSNKPSPFKVLSNQDTQGRFPPSASTKSKLEVGHSPLKTYQAKTQQIKSPSPVKSNNFTALEKKLKDSSPLTNTKQKETTNAISDKKALTGLQIEGQQLETPGSATNNTMKALKTGDGSTLPTVEHVKYTNDALETKRPKPLDESLSDRSTSKHEGSNSTKQWQKALKTNDSSTLYTAEHVKNTGDVPNTDRPKQFDEPLSDRSTSKHERSNFMKKWQKPLKTKDSSTLSTVEHEENASNAPDMQKPSKSEDIFTPPTVEHVQKTSDATDNNRDKQLNESLSDRSTSKHEGSNSTKEPQDNDTMNRPKMGQKKNRSTILEKNRPGVSKDPSSDRSSSNHDGSNKSDRNSRGKSTRAIRLMKARRATTTATSSSRAAAKTLKQSLQAAKIVMQEEKKDTGASDTSSRSSLSNKELSDIAKRALNKAKNKIQIQSDSNVNTRQLDRTQQLITSTDVVQEATGGSPHVIENNENGMIDSIKLDHTNQEAQENEKIANGKSDYSNQVLSRVTVNNGKERAEVEESIGKIAVAETSNEPIKMVENTKLDSTNKEAQENENVVSGKLDDPIRALLRINARKGKERAEVKGSMVEISVAETSNRTNKEAQEDDKVVSGKLDDPIRALLRINARKGKERAEVKGSMVEIAVAESSNPPAKTKTDESSRSGKDVVPAESTIAIKAVKKSDAKMTVAEGLNEPATTKKNESSRNGVNIVQTLSTHSMDASKSRRLDHPAFAGRPGQRNVSSAHILASFRQYNATRPHTPEVKKRATLPLSDKNVIAEGHEIKRSLSGDDSLSSGTSTASLEQDQTMHSVTERPGDNSIRERFGESMHSMSDRLGESMHSTSSRKHADQFYRMHRVHVISKNCNDTVISSLSGNTRSIQSTMSQSAASKMMSPTNGKTQNSSFRLEPTPEYSSQRVKPELNGFTSPGPSNRSSHSFANSINSATPRVGQQSPSFRDRVDTTFLDTLDEIQSSSQETGLNSADLLDAALEAAIDEFDFVKPPMTNRNNTGYHSKLNSGTRISILQSSSGRSHSPPGFVFKDTDESDAIGPPDPIGREGCALADSICIEEDSTSTSTFEQSERTDECSERTDDRSFREEIGRGIMKEDAFVDFEDVTNAKEHVYQKQGSTSTKRTVSTSIRSGMSSIQNTPPVEEVRTDPQPTFESGNREPEGSTSIRTGLSGIQSQKESNDMENSISVHMNVIEIKKDNEKIQSMKTDDGEGDKKDESNENEGEKKDEGLKKGNEKGEGDKQEEPSLLINMIDKTTTLFSPRYPDTIQEETEVKSTQQSTASLKDEGTSFSVLKVKSTATTDGSSGTTTGASSSLQPSSDPSLNANNASNTRMTMIPPIETEDNTSEDMSNNGMSMLTPGGSRSSRPWKTIGNAIKNVLAKASPRASIYAAATPSNKSQRQENEGCETIFSDDDDDIFGGLEVEEDEQMVKNTVPQGKQKIVENTPKLANLTLNEGSPRAAETTVKRTLSSSRRSSSGSKHTSSSSKRTPTNSRRTPTNSRRTPTNSRRTPTNSRRTPSNSKRSSFKSDTPRFDGIIKPPTNTSSHNPRRNVSSAVATEVNNNSSSLHSNDRSGMVVEESQVVHNVNSDITSSLIGGPISGGPIQFPKAANENRRKLLESDDKVHETFVPQTDFKPDFPKEEDEGSFTLLMEEDDGETFTLLMEETDTSLIERKKLKRTSDVQPQPKEEEPMEPMDSMEPMEFSEDNDDSEKQSGCMFLNFGCGFTDPCSGLASFCAAVDKVEEDENVAEENTIGEVDDDRDFVSVSSQSQLTSLEKKVWNEWDRLNDGVLRTNITDKTDEWENDYDKKRETARDKLLDIASTALSSHLSGKSGKSSILDDDQNTKLTFLSEEPTVSASGSTETFSTKGTESGASGHSSAFMSGDSMDSSSQESTHYSTSYSSDEESDEPSEDLSHSSRNQRKTQAPAPTPTGALTPTSTSVMTPTAGPILLSFSQRSLMEKFSKQLTSVGVQVLKLNTRNQWQTRFFTVSTEQIALSAHEAISKTGEIAQCPKALLWLKKFSPKTGGYGIVNIDKNGHGGMLLVDLVDIQASDRRDDMVGNPIPKKLMDNFENSVLVTLKYKMKGVLRSIEFRCRDNDEAQFLCTCMRVIRDLLRRERSLRQKLSKQAPSKKNTPSSSRRR